MSEPETVPDQPAGVARYRISRLLGGGGTGFVYLARNPVLPRWEALKVLVPELAGIPAATERFVQEAHTTSTLNHPNIVKIFGRGETKDGRPWFAMEYVEGIDAETALRRGEMAPPRAVHIVTQVAHALDYAHLSGVVHQDIKPANFLLGHRLGAEREVVVLTDFGAAVTVAEALDRKPGDALVASLAYTAPEVITGTGSVDGRADVYSLGCTLFRLLTGSVPFSGHVIAAAIAHAHLELLAPRPSELLPWATAELDAVMATALAKDPDDRFSTAGEFAAAAAHALRAPTRPTVAPISTPPPPRVLVTPVETRGWSGRSKRWVLAVAAATAVLFAVLLAWLLNLSLDDRPAALAPTTTTPAPSSLQGVLPPGYPPHACTPTEPTDASAVAVMTCGPNPDPGGPASGVYTMVRDGQSLQAALTRVIGTATTVICPGNIQSPVLCPTGVSTTVEE